MSKVRKIYGLDEETKFRNVTVSSDKRPEPLYLATATQIGVLPTEGIPSLLKVLLPSSCTGLPALDIQAYVSQAFLYFAPLSKRIFILVDNRPWLVNKLSKSARLWQLVVTKYRISPFMNSKAIPEPTTPERHEANHDKSKKSSRWFPSMVSMKLKHKYLRAVLDLSRSLHGFIVFEVTWKDVHGINYLNELQIDTSLALEVRSMKKWEFFSPDQASNCMSLWFSGRISETQSLKNYLKKLSEIDIQNFNARTLSKELSLPKAHPLNALPEEEEMLDAQETPFTMTDDKTCSMLSSQESECPALGSSQETRLLKSKQVQEAFITPSQYADTLILFKINDSLLPSKLQQIIMSDIRLLTLLESGLPSWVIFFQSYPLFCHFYRPWMRPLVKILYILISLTTVIIGFYDLYKNVPVLKATAARLCGPLFLWIEAWDMATGIKYLGTMLFLRNFRNSCRWLLAMARATRTIIAAVAEPLSSSFSEIQEFISPVLNICVEISELLSSATCSLIDTIQNLVLIFTDTFLWPLEALYTYILTAATSIYPLVCFIWNLLLFPVQCLLSMSSFIGLLLSNTYEFLKDIWETISSIFELTYLSETQPTTYDISVLQDLWQDLLSQVFRPVRSIINGLVAFCISCNRHRLSIYNYMKAFFQYLACILHLSPPSCKCHKKLQIEEHQKEDLHECDHCK